MPRPGTWHFSRAVLVDSDSISALRHETASPDKSGLIHQPNESQKEPPSGPRYQIYFARAGKPAASFGPSVESGSRSGRIRRVRSFDDRLRRFKSFASLSSLRELRQRFERATC